MEKSWNSISKVSWEPCMCGPNGNHCCFRCIPEKFIAWDMGLMFSELPMPHCHKDEVLLTSFSRSMVVVFLCSKSLKVVPSSNHAMLQLGMDVSVTYFSEGLDD